MTTKNKRLIIVLLTASVLLTLPWIAMQFSTEVNWKPFDFIVMGILLFGTGITCELMLRKVKSRGYRMILCGAALLCFFLVWAELAVGIFGTRFAGS